MNKIVIMGLGAGDINQLPLGVYKKLLKAELVYTRTIDHPVIDVLIEEGVNFHSFDNVYEKYDTFAEVYEDISDEIIRLAEEKDVLYTVPGHPMVAEMTVQLLIQKTKANGIELLIEGGQSFLDALFQAVKIDPIDGFQLLDGTALKKDEVQITQHLIIGQVYDAFIASDVKLTLMDKYSDDYNVAIVTAAGSSEERVKWVPLYELDRETELSNLTSVYVPPVQDEHLMQKEFSNLRNVIAILRGPNGCPWDKKQTHVSLKKYLIEESYELLEAIDEGDTESIISELGDVLLQVLLHAQIGEDEGMFAIEDVIETLCKKMIRRHPHVFSNITVENEEDVIANWNEIKKTEKEFKGNHSSSLLDDIENSLPQMLLAYQYQNRAAKVGFDWDCVEDAWSKVEEEINEFKQEATKNNQSKMLQEFGDVLFAIINIARFYQIYPEEALQTTNVKFKKRFQYIEQALMKDNKTFEECSLEQLDQLWEYAKQIEE